jgi:hypothetical protein
MSEEAQQQNQVTPQHKIKLHHNKTMFKYEMQYILEKNR